MNMFEKTRQNQDTRLIYVGEHVRLFGIQTLGQLRISLLHSLPVVDHKTFPQQIDKDIQTIERSDEFKFHLPDAEKYIQLLPSSGTPLYVFFLEYQVLRASNPLEDEVIEFAQDTSDTFSKQVRQAVELLIPESIFKAAAIMTFEQLLFLEQNGQSVSAQQLAEKFRSEEHYFREAFDRYTN